jgi:L-threonylcarbamoyladenylate synthase
MSKIVKVNPNNIEKESLKEAVDYLKSGDVVAFPTETVYGLGANALSASAIAKIFEAKNRPSDNPLIVHVSSLKMLSDLLYPDAIPSVYSKVIHTHWPGALTILVKKPNSIPDIVCAGHETMAVRMPSHPIARALIDQCGFPLAAPSANTSGRPSPTSALHVFKDMSSRIKLILDGGPCVSGVESTVLDGLREIPAILRPGGVTFEQLKPFFDNLQVYKKDFSELDLENAPTTPGMKYRHYSPDLEVILIEAGSESRFKMLKKVQELTEVGRKVGVLTSGSLLDRDAYPNSIHFIHLGNTAGEVAQVLFSGLRQMEDLGVDVVVMEGIGEEDEGLAVMNRMRKAASSIIN